MNEGWECPRCHRCYAPWVYKCEFCEEGKTVYTNNTTTGIIGPPSTVPTNQDHPWNTITVKKESI